MNIRGLFLAWLCLAAPLFSDDFSCLPLAEVQGDPSALVAGCINVITGAYIVTGDDLSIPAANPMHFQRYYSSSDSSPASLFCAWHHNFPCGGKIEVSNEKKYSAIFPAAGKEIQHKSNTHCREVSFDSDGDSKPSTIFLPPKKDVTFEIFDDSDNGIANTGTRYIGGRTNVKNQRVKYEKKWKRVSALRCDGGIQSYSLQGKKTKHQTLPLYFRLDKETEPNGNAKVYSYAGDTLCSIATEDRKSCQIGKFDIGRIDLGTSIPGIRITASNGQYVTYHPCFTNRRHFIEKAVHSSGYWESYHYEPSKEHKHAVKMTERRRPDNRFHQLDYYHSGHNSTYVHADHVKVKELEKDGLTMGRVKHLKAPVGYDATPHITHCLTYEWNWCKKSRTDYHFGHVNVYDTLRHKTLYQINSTQHLDFIYQFVGNSDATYQLYSRERFYWGGPCPGQHCDLVAKCIEDAQGSVRSCRHLKYDQDHNVIAETTLGNLSGRCTINPKVDQKGIPLENGVEKCTVHHTYSADALHLCTSDTFSDGRTHHYTYHPGTNLLASKCISDGQRTISRQFFEYDSSGAVNKMIEDDGSGIQQADLQGVTVRKITYASNRLEAPALGLPQELMECYLDKESGCEKQLNRKVHQYSTEGWLVRQDVYDRDDIFAYSLCWEYDGCGRVTLEQDALGQITTRRFDLNGNKIYEQGPDTRFYETYDYDFSNRLIAKNRICTDGASLTESYKYNILSQRVASFDIYGNETNYFYDDLGRLTKTVGPASPERLFITQEYDIVGNVIAQTDLAGNITRTRYNVRGQPCEVCHPDGTKELYEYTLEGRLERYTAPNKTTTHYSYDVLGNEIRKQSYAADGALLTSISATYYGHHKASETDANGNTTTFHYDGAGRLVCVKEPNRWKKLEYDALGRNHRTFQWIGPEEDHIQIQCADHDLLGRVIEERLEDVHGTILTRALFTYDAAGNRTSETILAAEGPCTTYTNYTCYGQIERITDAEENVTLTRYDHGYQNEQGQRVLQTTVIDPLGNQTVTTYDVLKRAVDTTQKDIFGVETAKTCYFYNAIGKLIRRLDTVKTPGLADYDHSVEWRYDAVGRVIEIIDALGTTQERQRHFHYNSVGQKEWEILYDGTRLCYAYNPLGRLSAYHTDDRTIDYHYIYDPNGNLLEVQDHNQGTSNRRLYDSANRMVRETFDHGLSIHYQYDGLGRIIHKSFPDGSGAHYTYDAAFLRSVTRLDTSQMPTCVHRYVTYDQGGNLLLSQMAGAAGTLSYRRDKLGRVRELSTEALQETIPPHGYDPAGNLLVMQTHDTLGPVTCEYQYDSLYQLSSENGVISTTYCHDSLNNRRRKGSIAYEVDVLNQLTRQGDTSYSYDLCGHRTHKKSLDSSFEYTYDALGRLTHVRTHDEEYTYTYDAFNRRLKRIAPDGTTTRYLYQDQMEIGAVDASDAITQLRLLGNTCGSERGATVLIECAGRSFAPVHNTRGHIVAILDALSGDLVEAYRFSAFGEEQHCFGTNPVNPWRFCGKRHDSETGLIAFGRRYYDSEVGRWLTPDPKGYDDGPNLYAYVHNNPLTRFDAFGLYTEDDWFRHDEYDHCDSCDLDSFLANYYASNAYSAACGCAKGSLDFAIETVHTIESQITHIGTQSLELECDLCRQVHHTLGLEQQERCACVDRWVMDMLQIDQDDAVYHNCCYATTVGLEVGTFVAGAYGLYRGGLALYRGAKSTLSLEMAATESSSLLRLTEVRELHFPGSGMPSSGDLMYSRSAFRHYFEEAKAGNNMGCLDRPYMRSPHTVNEIMRSGPPGPDPKGASDALLYWKVPGDFRGAEGFWELLINPDSREIYHFLFKTH